MLRREQFKQLELQFIGILILIYHDVLVSLACLFSERIIFTEYLIGEHEEVIKVHKIVLFDVLLIFDVNIGYLFVVRQLSFFQYQFR